MRTRLIFLLVLMLSCCSKKSDEKFLSSEGNEYSEMYMVKNIKDIPKVPIIHTIYEVSNAAVQQKWSRQTWIIRFGQPTSSDLLKDGSEIIRYTDHGPHQPPPSKFFLSGAEIMLVNDETVFVRYTHTEL